MEHLIGIDLKALIQAAGYLGLFAIIFAESGVFLGFFLPGDSLIFTAGFLASQGYFDPYLLAATFFLAATLGDTFGYWFGKRIGEHMYTWEDTWYFKKEFLTRTEDFYKTHGPSAVVLGRFIPIVRTFIPILAGAGQMRYQTFLLYNILGAVPWAIGMTFLGYIFGSILPNPDKYLLPVVLLIVGISFVPPIYRLVRERRRV